ncbi:MAG: phage tail tape measure protein [Clostridia bacterium]|nr:phage tail tape measure protein [Clostridia bacterium]
MADNKTLQIIVSAHVSDSVAQIKRDLREIQKEIKASNKEIFVDARINKIHIDKTAANYVKSELKKMFNTVTVDIDGKVLGFGYGTTTAVRKQADEIRKAISAAQKKLGNIQIDYGANFTAADGSKFEQFRQELERMSKELDVVPSDIAIISDQMDNFEHSLLASKKATAENTKEIEKFAEACRRADKTALDIEQNYLGKANDAQKGQYETLIGQLTSFRAHPENTTAGDIDVINDRLLVLKSGIISVSAEAEKATKAATAHAAALDKSLDSARTSLDAVKNKNWDTMDDSQKKRYQDLSNEIIRLRGSEELTEQATQNLQKRIAALGADADKTAASVKAAAAAAEKEAKALEAAYVAFDKAWADINRLDTSGLSEDQLKSFNELKEVVALINSDRGAASSGTIKAFTEAIQRSKGDIKLMLSELKKIQAESKKTDTALNNMGKKLGGFENQYGFKLNPDDYAELEKLKKELAELQATASPAGKNVEDLGSRIDKFMTRVKGNQGNIDTLTSKLNAYMTQISRIQNISGDTQGLDIRNVEAVRKMMYDLFVTVREYREILPAESKAMITEILSEFTRLGTINVSKVRELISALNVPDLATDDTLRKIIEGLDGMVSHATAAANAVDDLHHEMSDASRSQGFQNRVNDDIRKLDEFYEKYTKLRSNKAFADEYTQIRAGFDIHASEEAIKKNEDAMKDYIHRAKQAGLTTDTLGEKIQKAYQKFGGWAIVSGSMMRVISTIRDMINNVVELDRCLVELKKVTSEVSGEYDAFMQRTKSSAKEIGSTMTDLVSATADWARLGYSLSDSEELAKISTVYANVGDDIEGIDDATANLISTIQGFKELDASDALNVVDILNRVSNEFPASAGGLGESLRRSSAALSAAGNTLQESISLITAADAVLQDPASTGTMMKTISMYLRAAKTEAEEAGESVDGMANSVSELRAELMSLTGNRVDIMLNEDTFKSTYQIIKEISEVWDELTDVSQANILNLLAGKRNANAVSSLIENFDMAEAALNAANNAAGSAMAEHAKWLDSIEGKINQFKASFEALSSSVVNSDFLKALIDGGTAFISVLDTITQKIGPLPGLLMGITTAMNIGGFGRQKSTCLSNMPKYTLVVTLNEFAA